MNTIRFGIMGAGAIANKFCHAVRLTENAEVVAVASKSYDRACRFAEKNGILSSYGSYEEMLCRDDIDAVYIATTHNFHADNLRLCIRYGKHILCEKPMVLTETDARDIFERAKQKGLFCMEAMWSCFLPPIQKAKAWIRSGAIGKIESVDAVIGFRGDRDPESRLLNPKLAGGAMYDIGVYPVEIVSYLMGEPILDSRSFVRVHESTGVDINVSLLLRFPSADAALRIMFTCNPKAYIILNGTEGTIEIEGVTSPNTCKLYDNDRQEAASFSQEFPEGNGFVYEIGEAVRCINEGKLESDVIPHAATIECCRLYDTVLRHKKQIRVPQ